MQTLWRKFWGTSNDNVVDANTGLTGREVKLVQSTWAIVYKDPAASGIALMLCFMERHPDYQKFFPAFKNVPFEDLPTNKRFQAHALNVMGGLNNIVGALNYVKLLEETLVSIGQQHCKRGQTEEQFINLKYVVLDVLRQSLGAEFTAETEEAWKKTLEVAYTLIFKGLSS